MKAFQRTVFFDHKLYPSMEELSNSDSSIPHMPNTVTLSNPECGDDTFSETLVRTTATWSKIPEGIYINIW
jgi:hypothetical protein